MSEKLIEEITKLLSLLFQWLGPGWTLLLIFGGLGFGLVYYIYRDRQRIRKENQVIEAKNGEIQRLAEQNRELRVLLFKREGWSSEEIEKFVLKNLPKDSIEARKMLEEANEGKLPINKEAKPKPQTSASKRKRRPQ